MRLLRRLCLLAAVALCAVALGKAVPSSSGPAAVQALAASLRDLDAGKIMAALQGLRLRPVREACREFWDIFGPGGRLHPGWFIEHQGHLFIEGGLMAIILVLFFQPGYRPAKEQDEEPLTERVRRGCGWDGGGRRRRGAGGREHVGAPARAPAVPAAQPSVWPGPRCSLGACSHA